MPPRLRFLLLLAGGMLLSILPVLGNDAPVFTPPTVDPALAVGGGGKDVDLRGLFRDPEAPGSAVRVDVRIGTETKPVIIALFDQQTPITVANFLSYITAGRAAQNFFHRSVPGFVVQGGGYRWVTSIEKVPAFAPIQNEPGISN